MRENRTQPFLSEQGASKERIGAYLRRWLGSAGVVGIMSVMLIVTSCGRLHWYGQFYNFKDGHKENRVVIIDLLVGVDYEPSEPNRTSVLSHQGCYVEGEKILNPYSIIAKTGWLGDELSFRCDFKTDYEKREYPYFPRTRFYTITRWSKHQTKSGKIHIGNSRFVLVRATSGGYRIWSSNVYEEWIEGIKNERWGEPREYRRNQLKLE